VTRLGVVIVAVVVAAAQSVHAETAEQQVERLALEAVDAYKIADYKHAVELLRKAYEIRQVPALLYNMAKAYDKLGDIDHAYESYRLYADSAAAEPKLKARAEERVAALSEARRKKAAEQRVTEPPRTTTPPATATTVPATTGPAATATVAAGPPLSPEEQRARSHDEFVRKRRRGRVVALALGGATVAFAAVAVGLSVDALSKQHAFNAATDPDAKSRLKSESLVRAGVADGFWAATAAAAAVTGYFVYLGFRSERAPPVALAPLVVPGGGGLVAAVRF